LFRYASYLDGTGQDARSYWFAFWSKVMAPINVLLMMMVVVPYSFSSQRSLGAGQRIVVGALLGLGFALLGRAMGHVGLVYNLSPIFSAMLPAVLLAVMTVWGMRRVR
jgi:lipopolysaccharide export system permease protein